MEQIDREPNRCLSEEPYRWHSFQSASISSTPWDALQPPWPANMPPIYTTDAQRRERASHPSFHSPQPATHEDDVFLDGVAWQDANLNAATSPPSSHEHQAPFSPPFVPSIPQVQVKSEPPDVPRSPATEEVKAEPQASESPLLARLRAIDEFAKDGKLQQCDADR